MLSARWKFLISITKLLRDYYNKRVIVYMHIRAIMEIPSIAKKNSSELRKIVDDVSKHIRAL